LKFVPALYFVSLIALTLGYSTTLVAERYAYEEIPLSDVIVINNSNKVLGHNALGQPTVLIYTAENRYSRIIGDTTVPNTAILSLAGLDAKEVHATDINSPAPEDESSEIVSGWYLDLDDKEHAVIWRNTEGAYTDEQLPNFKKEQNICPESGVQGNDCILREEIEDVLIAVQTSQGCDNSAWTDWVASDPFPTPSIVTECDFRSKAYALNDNGIVVGISIRYDGTTRAIAWEEEEITSDDETATPEVAYVARDLATINVGGKINSLIAQASKINRHSNEITGEIFKETEARFNATLWSDTTKAPVDIVKDAAGTHYDNPIGITSITLNGVIGWYADNSGLIRPVRWRRFQNDQQELVFESKDIITLEEDIGYGRIYQANDLGEFVGASGLDPANYRAYKLSPQCGVQNLNELLAFPNPDLSLKKALSVTTRIKENFIVASGQMADDTTERFYVLSPTSVDIDLQTAIISDHERLTVGEKHTYSIVIRNNSDIAEPNKYATCLSANIAPVIPVKRDTSLNPDLSEIYYKSGGLTIISAEGTDGVICNWTPIDVNCFVDRLDPGQFVTVTLLTEPRIILADRTIAMTSIIQSSENEIKEDDNKAITFTHIDREGCFIATAAYGSYLEEHVQTLRKFRDDVLLKTSVGRWLVHQYYKYSPELADYIAQHSELRMIVRWLLTPIVWIIEKPLLFLFALSGMLMFIALLKTSARRTQPM